VSVNPRNSFANICKRIDATSMILCNYCGATRVLNSVCTKSERKKEKEKGKRERARARERARKTEQSRERERVQESESESE